MDSDELLYYLGRINLVHVGRRGSQVVILSEPAGERRISDSRTRDPSLPGALWACDDKPDRDFRYLPTPTGRPVTRSPCHPPPRHPARSPITTRAALWPGMPVTPPPGCAPEPHRYRPASGVR